jgi:hypothetical protein
MNKSILCIASSLLFSIAACDAGLGQTSSSLTAADGDGARDPRRPHGPPPPEAIAACDGLEVGAACSFTLDGGTSSGVCHADPRGEGPNACGPDGPPPGDIGDGGEHRGPPPVAIAACADLAAGAVCSFTAPDGNAIEGTCEAGPSADLPNACRPANAPPPPPPGL